jgi:hypothetical protein
MGDLEDALNRRFYLIDSWSVHYQQLLLFVISLIIFASYSVFLWILCSLSPNILVLLLLVGTQIGLGLPLTRAYYEFGISTRKTMEIFDPGFHGIKGNGFDLRINTGELPLVFEQLELQISKYDAGKLDDLTDISWFLVIVWAIVSSVAHYISISGQVIFIFGVVVLISSCFLSYASGYWTRSGSLFEEDLHHLEYYIDTFVKTLDSVLPNLNGTLILQLIDRRRNSILVDIALEFVVRKTITLKYHFGLSSSLDEHFVIEAPSEVIDVVYEDLVNSNSIPDTLWTIERVATQSGEIIRIFKSTHRLNISDRGSYVSSPAAIEQRSRATGEVLSTIVSTIDGHH